MPDLEELFGGYSNLSALLQLIYSAVDDASLWTSVLERVAALLNGAEILIWSQFQSTVVDNIVAVAQMDKAALDPYVSYYAGLNILSQRCDLLYRDGKARYSDRAVPDSEFVKTEFYNDYFRPNGMHYSIGMKVPLEGHHPAYLACMRPAGNRPFDDTHGLILETIMPHLKRALELYLRLSQLKINAVGMSNALDAFGHAVFGLNLLGRVVACNREAERLLENGSYLALQDGTLAAVAPRDKPAFQQLLAATLSPERHLGSPNGLSIQLNGHNQTSSLLVSATPCNHALDLHRQLAVLLFVVDPSTRTPSREGALKSLYRLSPTECRIVAALSDGIELAEVAHRLRITQGTARFHLKKIFAKTGVRRQSQLLRMVLSLPSQPAAHTLTTKVSS